MPNVTQTSPPQSSAWIVPAPKQTQDQKPELKQKHQHRQTQTRKHKQQLQLQRAALRAEQTAGTIHALDWGGDVCVTFGISEGAA
eukprot:gene9803-357_t